MSLHGKLESNHIILTMFHTGLNPSETIKPDNVNEWHVVRDQELAAGHSAMTTRIKIVSKNPICILNHWHWLGTSYSNGL